MFILDFSLKAELLDVNITPDKRTVLLHNEQSVIDILRESLIEYYDNQEMALPKNEPTDQTAKRRKVLNESSDNLDEGSSVNDDYSLGKESSFVKQKEMDITELIEHSTSYDEGYRDVESKRLPNSEPDYIDDGMTQISDTNGEGRSAGRNLYSDDEQMDDCDYEENKGTDKKNTSSKRSKVFNIEEYANPNFSEKLSQVDSNEESEVMEEPVIVEIDEEQYTHRVKMTQDNNLVFIEEDKVCLNSSPTKENTHSSKEDNNDENDDYQNTTRSEDQLNTFDEDNDDQLVSLNPSETNIRSPLVLQPNRPSKRDIYRSMTDNVLNKNKDEIINFCLKINGLENSNDTLNIISKIKTELQSDKKAQILKNNALEDLDKGAEYLSLSVKKRDFQDMSIVGQFNLGFIIVTRKVEDKYDLFIVDQHASDEKYNFETLQQTTKFKSQRLISPQTIELSVIDELIVMDNIEVFERNGFKISVDEDALAGQKIKLISIPISKRTVFGVSDFHELIYLIKEDGGVNKNSIRCSKIRSMFAMRACRSSIMVGKPLNKRTMVRVVQNLSTLDKPWNCPHGRPTMRHLMELKDFQSFSEDYQI